VVINIIELIEYLQEAITGGVVQPGIVVGATDASVKMEGFSGQFLGRQLAGAGSEARRRRLNVALLLPGVKVFGLVRVLGILDPLDDLSHSDEVNILVLSQNLIDPVEEGIEELGVVLEPGSVEEETKRGTVLIVVTVEVVSEEIVELIAAQDVGARVDHSTSGKVFIDGGIFPTIELVHDHFPDSVGTGGAVLERTVASVGHAEVHGVRPKRGVLKGSSDGRIVKESLLFHHGKLVVTTNSEVRGSQANNGVISDVRELVNDQSGSSHFLGPVIDRGLSPEGLGIVVSDGVSGDFVTHIVDVLNSGVVGVLVRNKEGRLDITTVGVLPLPVEDLVVQVNVVVVDGVIEGDHDHLRNVLAVGSSGSDIAKFSRNLGAILRAEAVGQLTDGSITRRSSVGIGFNVASVLI